MPAYARKQRRALAGAVRHGRTDRGQHEGAYLLSSANRAITRGAAPARRARSSPVLNNVSPEALADHLKGTHAMMLDFDGAKICLVLPAQASALTALVDGDRELAEICRHLRKAKQKL